MPTAPVRYSPDVEQPQEGEADTIQELNDTFDQILETVAENSGHAIRSVHAKAHGILKGTLTIDDNLPPELAQGLFAKPGEHDVWLRMSTNAGDILHDGISLPRGFAIKVLDVAGERLPGADGTTQDFIMNNGRVFVAKSADKFLSNLKLLAKTTDRGEGAKQAFSAVLQTVNKGLQAVGIDSPTVQTMGGAPNLEPLGVTFFSVTPFRYGDYIAKFSAKPIAPEQLALEDKEIAVDGDYDAIRHQVREEARGFDMAWEFRVQLARDLEKQPIEDPTVEWKEEDAPFARVGVIRARAQDSWDDAQVDEVEEHLRFSIWTGLAAHQPLGNINRARNEPYRHSAQFRERFNGCPIHEPAAAAA